MEPKVFIPVVNSIQGLSLTAQLGLLGYPCIVDLKTIFKAPEEFEVMAHKSYWVYILLCENNTYYTGYTHH